MRARLFACAIAIATTGMSGPGLAGEACAPAQARRIHIGAQTFKVDIAADLKQRERGLSGRTALTAESGLWFVFPTPERHGFWMKDMSFPIDLIWVGPARQVLGSMTLQPCAAAPCPIHFPTAPVAYVLEVNAGAFAGKAGDPVAWSCTP